MTAFLLAVALFTAGDDSLAAARDLYASAAYEEALAMLNRLPEANRPSEEARAVGQYRAMCLLALGRQADAERAIETAVTADPAFRPTGDMSPRVRAMFTDVRKRVLPTIIQQKYTTAKAAFDRKDYAVAASGFTQMLEMMTDPDALAASNQPPLSDLRTLAAGFRDLAVSASAPPSAPAPQAAPAAVAPAGPRIYTASDPNVIPPIVILQQLPPYPGHLLTGHSGVIELLIDETGAVESAVMRQSVTSQYDALALNAAKGWRYRPATLNGVAVKYRKAVQIAIRPDTQTNRRN
jgi:TonB family protein